MLGEFEKPSLVTKPHSRFVTCRHRGVALTKIGL